jgi:glycosyltransferase involved in cell wall biosynthesis
MEADAVICISNTTCRDVINYYGINPDSTYVVSIAYSEVFKKLDKNGYILRLPTKKPFLLYVGNRNSYKNFGILVKAYSSWKGAKEVDLIVVGSPLSVDEKMHLNNLGIQDYVHSITHLNDNDLCYLYNYSSAFVHTSIYEGFGIPILEAMACGCPVIASHIPSTIEIAGDCPVYFEPKEVDDLIDSFDIVLNEGRQSERVQEGIKKARCFSWDKTAKQTLEVYRSVV